jgi:hypothetical protein
VRWSDAELGALWIREAVFERLAARRCLPGGVSRGSVLDEVESRPGV